MSYVESELQKRRQESNKTFTEECQQHVKNPADELFQVTEKYRHLQEEAHQLIPSRNAKPFSEEGNSTLSAAMHSKVPEIDLGLKYVVP